MHVVFVVTHRRKSLLRGNWNWHCKNKLLLCNQHMYTKLCDFSIRRGNMDVSVLCFGSRCPFPLVSVLSICPPGSVILKLESVSINSLKCINSAFGDLIYSVPA